jgi:hypothetical protein
MNRFTGKPSHKANWVGAALGILVLMAAPPRVSARPYSDEGPPPPSGDPTADDQPSPTPKGGVYSASQPYEGTAVRLPGSTIRRSTLPGRLIWLSFVRTWIRIGMR